MNFVEMALHRHCTSVHFSIQPSCTPARDEWHRVPAQGMRAVGRSVGRSVWYQISHAIQVHRFIHWVTRIPSSGSICGIQVMIYGYPVTAGEEWLQPRDRLS